MIRNGSIFLPVIAALLLLAMVNPGAASAGGPIGDAIPIFTDNADQVHADVAYNPHRQQYLVVWYNDRPDNDDIYARRLSRDGKLLSWAAISAGSGAERRYPQVAYNYARHEYLVVWEHHDGGRPHVRARRVRWDGVLQGGEIVLGTGALANRQRPVIGYAQTSDNYLVAWERLVQGSPAKDIEIQVLTSLGAPDGASKLVAEGTWSVSHEKPDLAYNRSRNEYLVAWEWLNLNTSDYDVYGRLLEAHGGFLGKPIFPIYVDAGPDRSPAVAAIPAAPVPNQGQYLIVWQSPWKAGNADIYGRRMSGQGSMNGPVLWIGPTGGTAANPAVAGSEGAREYLVAWNEVVSHPHSAVHARTVSMDGEFTSETRRLWWSYSDRPAVASGPLGDFLTAFQFQNPDWDIYGRFWGNRVYLPLVVRNY